MPFDGGSAPRRSKRREHGAGRVLHYRESPDVRDLHGGHHHFSAERRDLLGHAVDVGHCDVVTAYTTSYFLTARLAARRMVANKSGVIMTVTSLPARTATRLNGEGYLAATTHPRRVMTLDEVAGMAVFMASDKASGMTGTTVNLTMGSVDD
jgi:hypothetical protein